MGSLFTVHNGQSVHSTQWAVRVVGVSSVAVEDAIQYTEAECSDR